MHVEVADTGVGLPQVGGRGGRGEEGTWPVFDRVVVVSCLLLLPLLSLLPATTTTTACYY